MGKEIHDWVEAEIETLKTRPRRSRLLQNEATHRITGYRPASIWNQGVGAQGQVLSDKPLAHF
jgi:hypothetical protein